MAELTNTEVDQIVEAASTVVEGDEVDTLNKAKESTEVDEGAELESDVIYVNPDKQIVQPDTEDYINVSDTFFDDALNDEAVEKKIGENISNTINQKFGDEISDEEAFEMIQVINDYRRDNRIPVFQRLPQYFQNQIRSTMAVNNIPATNTESVTRFVIEELISEANIDNTFVDFETTISDALKMPSVTDMYSEHMYDIMFTQVPDAIKDLEEKGEHENAEKLTSVLEAFKAATDVEKIKQAYCDKAAIRKAVRRYDLEYDRCIEYFNFKNDKSKFRMQDVSMIDKALRAVKKEIDKNKSTIELELRMEFTHEKDSDNPDDFYPIVNFGQKYYDICSAKVQRVILNDIEYALHPGDTNPNSDEVVEEESTTWIPINKIIEVNETDENDVDLGGFTHFNYGIYSYSTRFNSINDNGDIKLAGECVICPNQEYTNEDGEMFYKSDDEAHDYLARLKSVRFTATLEVENFNETDIKKFIIALCKSCELCNQDDIGDAAYMYYVTKNIIMLMYTNEGKTNFSLELINNIRNFMFYIRREEDKFNEFMSNVRKSGKHKR